MRLEITDDAGQVMLDGQLLPGLFAGLEVEGELEIDEQGIPGSSERSRQIQGYKPMTVKFKVILPTDEESTCFDKLRKLTQVFKRTDSSARPFLRRIVNEHTAAWGIDEVLFKSLRTADDSKTDSLTAEIAFEEWRPTAVRSEAAARGSSSVELDPELQRLLGYGDQTKPQQQTNRRKLIED